MQLQVHSDRAAISEHCCVGRTTLHSVLAVSSADVPVHSECTQNNCTCKTHRSALHREAQLLLHLQAHARRSVSSAAHLAVPSAPSPSCAFGTVLRPCSLLLAHTSALRVRRACCRALALATRTPVLRSAVGHGAKQGAAVRAVAATQRWPPRLLHSELGRSGPTYCERTVDCIRIVQLSNCTC